jgi:hypothetical protein
VAKGSGSKTRSRPRTSRSGPRSALSTRLDTLLHFLERSRPNLTEELGEGTVLEEFASGLTVGAVAGPAISVNNALDGRTAPGAWLPELPVRRHRFVERGDLLGGPMGASRHGDGA